MEQSKYLKDFHANGSIPGHSRKQWQKVTYMPRQRFIITQEQIEPMQSVERVTTKILVCNQLARPVDCWWHHPITSKHHHPHERFTKSAIPLFTNICNHPGDEAKVATTHLGQPFLHAVMKSREVAEFP